MIWQNVAVAGVVLAAGWYLARVAWSSWRGAGCSSGCGKGCSAPNEPKLVQIEPPRR